MTSRAQTDALTSTFLRHPESIPAHRFEPCGNGRIRCVLCKREGYGVVAVDPEATYPQRERGHRILLQFFDHGLVQVEGPDTAPPPPTPVKPIHQFSKWQIACLQPHDWECTCGRRYVTFGTLWRHIGGPRPTGWGRQDGIDHAVVEHEPWPAATTRPSTLDTGGSA